MSAPSTGPAARGVALVTGGARGIGRAIAEALARTGFDVAVMSLEALEAAAPVLAEIERQGRRALYLPGDVAALDRHGAALAEIGRRLGPLDCLVNNAGVTSLRRGDMLEVTPESFDRSIAVNLRGTFFLTQSVAKAMLEAPRPGPERYRSIITISSLNADVVGANRADYCISKAELTMMTKLYAARLAAAGIAVFEIRPGIIRTEMTAPATETYDAFIARGGVPFGRWGEPAEVGAMVASVASGALPFDTGDVLNVGGGIHLHRI